ncbi:MAG: zf-HC2 domain-containing protein [Longimicrobiales bacterium]|nr:zf-HC2 domain-containing protein [Longimicrobiales bacterium]
MDCREFLQRYSEYDDSLIPPEEGDRFRAHMAACPSCARYDRVLRKGRMLARQLPRVEPSPDFGVRLRRRLLQQRRHGVSRGSRLAAGLAAATVLMVAATAVRLMGPASAPVAIESARGADRVVAPAGQGAVAAAGMVAVTGGVPVVRRVALPELAGRTPRDWAVREVAPVDAASYSPLETGPPAYPGARPSPRTARFTDTRRALD